MENLGIGYVDEVVYFTHDFFRSVWGSASFLGVTTVITVISALRSLTRTGVTLLSPADVRQSRKCYREESFQVIT